MLTLKIFPLFLSFIQLHFEDAGEGGANGANGAGRGPKSPGGSGLLSDREQQLMDLIKVMSIETLEK